MKGKKYLILLASMFILCACNNGQGQSTNPSDISIPEIANAIIIKSSTDLRLRLDEEQRVLYVVSSNLTNREINVSSSDESIATVEKRDGKVYIKAKGEGDAVITLSLVSDPTKKAEINVRVDVSIYDDRENEFIYGHGGVRLEGDNGIIFPDYMSGVDGILEGNCSSLYSPYYATLKPMINLYNFKLEFDMSNCVIDKTLTDSRFLLSLGEKNNAFNLLLNDNAKIIEAYGHTSSTLNITDYDKVGKEIKDFETNVVHHFELESDKGVYKLYIDDEEVAFEKALNATTLALLTKNNIRFATKGMSCKILNIKVTTCEDNVVPSSFAKNASLRDNGDGTYALSYYSTNGWGDRGILAANTFVLRDFANLRGAYNVQFKLKFVNCSQRLKFITVIGKHEFHVCYDPSSGTSENKLEHCDLNNNTFAPNSLLTYSNQEVTISLTKTVDGKVTFSAPGTTGMINVSGVEDEAMWFWGYNSKSDTGKSVVMSDIQITK